jgi:malate dehydrogenase (oxaloacetate-decarboxylating)
MNPEMASIAERTNPRGSVGGPNDVLAGADLLVGVSAPGAVSYEGVRSMADAAIVFALANPVPEIRPEEVPANVAIMATGRTDYPNQINNVLAFPGVFKGALKVRASSIDATMKLAAARAIADVIPGEELGPEHIVPSVFDRRVAESVAEAVADAAIASGLARHVR